VQRLEKGDEGVTWLIKWPGERLDKDGCQVVKERRSEQGKSIPRRGKREEGLRH